MKNIFQALIIILLIGFASTSHADMFEDMRARAEQDEVNKKHRLAYLDSKLNEPGIASKIKKLGMTTQQFKEKLFIEYGDDNNYDGDSRIEEYLDSLERRIITDKEDSAKEIKAIAFEKTAKIKKGKQYICSDGYDSWVLKYPDDYQFTFGGVHFSMLGTSFTDVLNFPSIDRAKGTVTYQGNKSTCKPR